MIPLSYKEKISLLKDLLLLTRVDNVESEVEVDFVYELGRRLAIEQTDIDTLLQRKVEFTPPEQEHTRITIFYTYILVVKVDGRIAKEEIDFCREVGLKLGLNQLAVNNLLKAVSAHPEKNFSPNEVVQFFKLHHN